MTTVRRSAPIFPVSDVPAAMEHYRCLGFATREGVRVTAPIDTDWGQHEGAHIDPYGNVIRFGSPVRRSA